MMRFRQVVSRLPEYKVATEDVPAKLNQNELPLDLPAEVKAEIAERLSSIPWNRYPGARLEGELLNELSEYVKLPVEWITCGVGSNELIQALMLTLLEPGNSIMVVEPGFIIYRRLAQLLQLQEVVIALDEEFQFPLPAILKNLNQADTIFFASPNNPTGTMLSLNAVEQILQNFDGVFLLDEAYYEFSGITATSLIERYPNLVILRTFSKAFGLAGIRAGYLLARPEIIKAVNKVKMPFSFGIPQLIICISVLRKRGLLLKRVADILSERERLYRFFAGHPAFAPVRSDTNFLLVKVHEGRAAQLYDQLHLKGVEVRYFPCGRLTDYLRITVGTPKENETLLRAISDIYK